MAIHSTDIVDFNIVGNGEISSPLHRILQEIEIIMTSDGDLITMPNTRLNLEQYLFKYGQNESMIASNIQRVIDENIVNLDKYSIKVEALFMKGKQQKDTLLINVNVLVGSELTERLIYTVSA